MHSVDDGEELSVMQTKSSSPSSPPSLTSSIKTLRFAPTRSHFFNAIPSGGHIVVSEQATWTTSESLVTADPFHHRTPPRSLFNTWTFV